VDIKKLARISLRGAGHRVLGVGQRASQYERRRNGARFSETGYEYLHLMVDDHSRVAYAELLDDLTTACAIAFLERALAWFADRGVQVHAVMSDNGSCYAARAYGRALAKRGINHHRTRLRPRLRQHERASHGARDVPPPLQLATTPRQPRPPTAGLATEQPR
jgi:hypothetical protein